MRVSRNAMRLRVCRRHVVSDRIWLERSSKQYNKPAELADNVTRPSTPQHHHHHHHHYFRNKPIRQKPTHPTKNKRHSPRIHPSLPHHQNNQPKQHRKKKMSTDIEALNALYGDLSTPCNIIIGALLGLAIAMLACPHLRWGGNADSLPQCIPGTANARPKIPLDQVLYNFVGNMTTTHLVGGVWGLGLGGREGGRDGLMRGMD